jgi:hypothetical protein
MPKKGDDAPITKVVSRLFNQKISNRTITHAKKTKPHNTIQKVNNIPMQISFDVVMYLVKDLVDLISFWPWH